MLERDDYVYRLEIECRLAKKALLSVINEQIDISVSSHLPVCIRYQGRYKDLFVHYDLSMEAYNSNGVQNALIKEILVQAIAHELTWQGIPDAPENNYLSIMPVKSGTDEKTFRNLDI